MYTAICSVVLAAGCFAIVRLYTDLRANRTVQDRLAELFRVESPSKRALPLLPKPRRFARRHYFIPWLVAIALAFAGHFGLHLPWTYSAAFCVLIGLLLGQLDATRLARVSQRIENQLADSIDLMIGSLKVGAALQATLENALRESQAPLRAQLEEVVGRIRLGDDPRNVVAGLAQRVPLESFQLFATALAVHWDVGGSLTETLATVGRTIRDRIEISNRLQSLTTQARASVVAVLLTTYFIAAVTWRSNPGRMSHFLASDVGQWMAAISIALQGVGIVWISYMRRVRY